MSHLCSSVWAVFTKVLPSGYDITPSFPFPFPFPTLSHSFTSSPLAAIILHSSANFPLLSSSRTSAQTLHASPFPPDPSPWTTMLLHA